MKLVTFRSGSGTQVGIWDKTGVQPLACSDMVELIERDTLPDPVGAPVPLDQVELLSPIPRPRQDVICLGINYQSHADETGKTFTDGEAVPIFFSKRVNEAVAPGGWIDSHVGFVEELDYEAELAVIIGRAARQVPPEDAAEYIFGYTILNDVSARKIQTRHKQWYFGKSLDGFTPMGPCIVTADEIAFPPALPIRSYVNGELRQESNTSLLLTDIAHIISLLSQGMTLLPGTILSPGTPSGVGMGFDPPRYMHPGDVVECEIEGIGRLRNRVR